MYWKTNINRIFLNFRIFTLSPPRDSLGLLVCYRGHFSVLETVDRVCVAICLRSNHKMTGLYV